MTPAPKFGGVPDRLRLNDWLLVEWVATAKPGDPFPAPWCHAHSPLRAMLGALAELGVMALPHPDEPVAKVAREATAAATAWLQDNPRPEPEPLPPQRGMRWGDDRRPWDR